ncbi:radical SAM protein [Streptomyces sp. NPDC005533]|uniref:radical SAM protein n=1 Tax=Streptomyces sp. NPDC005533 TaxID=3364723 RepID=UPI00367FFD76
MNRPTTQAATVNTVPTPEGVRLDFLWLELTNRCNLYCVHCYTQSSPQSGDRDKLDVQDYVSIMQEAFALACRSIQFIGGEPQLGREFPTLLAEATRIGFPFIEVFTNLTFLPEDTLRYAEINGIRFATSVYSDDAATHDAITRVRGSHAKTIDNLRRLIGAGVATRAGVIRVNQSGTEMDQTRKFLLDLGVPHVRSSDVREFGRGEEVLGREAQMTGLCGHCWNGKLCVAPDGEVFPCVMARKWPVGNIRQTDLAGIVNGMPLRRIRREIYESTWLREGVQACPQSEPGCPQSCWPGEVCFPNIIRCEPA